MRCAEHFSVWRSLRALLLVLALCGLVSAARAHKASDAYLFLERSADGLELRWDIALRDLDAALDLDRDGDRQLRWGEVRARQAEILAYSLPRLVIEGGDCGLRPRDALALEDRIDGAYLVLRLHATCTAPQALQVGYRLFAEIDPTHRGLLRVGGGAGAAATLHVLDPGSATLRVLLTEVPLAPHPARLNTRPLAASSDDIAPSPSGGFFRNGVHHILIGYDHVLFLVCLLLPAVLRRHPAGRWVPIARWRDAAWPAVGMVTMFTLAHSLTLALAALGWISLPSALIEPAIALTIMVAAADNFWPLLRGRRKLFAFLFGLIHGFGFAGVLGELELPLAAFVRALLSFNLGVEAGQLLIVALVLGSLFFVRQWGRYPALVLRAGSGLAFALASVWLAERLFDLRLLPV